MALFRLEAKIFSREKRGRSVIAAAAYRAGTRLRDELRDKIYDYARRSAGVLNSVVLAPAGAPAWVQDPATLWNTVERSEKRVDAQLAREFILALPRELSREAQFQTAKDWAERELVESGMVAELSLHHPKSGKNPHVHILCTLRKLEGDHFAAKKSREWNDVARLVKQRESWAAAVNAALEKAGRSERVDHRSLKDRGVDRLPEPKLGPTATAMKREGVDSERHQLVREVKMLNELRPLLKAVKAGGEVRQRGVGATWWEKSVVFAGRVREQAQRVTAKVRDTWRAFVEPRRPRPPQEPSR